MIQLDIAADELVIDNFAGGGGASTGMEQALGRPVDYAINHNRQALALHAANHTDTIHLCEDVWDVDIPKLVRGRKVGLAWFSPDCTFFSKARGGKPIREYGKKVRGLAWIVTKWAKQGKPRVIALENVEEFQFWGPVNADGLPCARRRGMTFKRWVKQLQNMGYVVEWREIRACHYGAPTLRKRLFVVARNDGKPIVWPEATHGKGKLPYRTAAECIDFSIPCPSIFLDKKGAKKFGVKRPLAEKTMQRIARGIEKFVLTNAKPFLVTLTHAGGDRVYSMDDPFKTVTGSHRGETAFVSPVIGSYYGANRPGGERVCPVTEPLRTQPTENRFSLIAPLLAGVGGRMGSSPERSVEKPYHTTTNKADTVLVTPFLERQFGRSEGNAIDAPMGTITAGGGGKTALVSPILVGAGGSEYAEKPQSAGDPLNTIKKENHTALAAVHLAKHFGGATGVRVDTPMPTITARGTQTQVVATHVMKMYGTNIGSAADEPLHTVRSSGLTHAEVRTFVAKEDAAEAAAGRREQVRVFLAKYLPHLKPEQLVIWIDGKPYEIIDIGMRMLSPRELFNAQGFPPNYVIAGGRDVCSAQASMLGGEWIELTATAQVRMCGNWVSPYPARAIIEAQFRMPEPMRAAA